MGKINWARVLLGGLVAGFIINIFEYVTNGVVLAADWDAAMKALGRHLSMSAVAVFHGPPPRVRPYQQEVERVRIPTLGIARFRAVVEFSTGNATNMQKGRRACA
jgi:hypothetical protein